MTDTEALARMKEILRTAREEIRKIPALGLSTSVRRRIFLADGGLSDAEIQIDLGVADVAREEAARHARLPQGDAHARRQ